MADPIDDVGSAAVASTNIVNGTPPGDVKPEVKANGICYVSTESNGSAVKDEPEAADDASSDDDVPLTKRKLQWSGSNEDRGKAAGGVKLEHDVEPSTSAFQGSKRKRRTSEDDDSDYDDVCLADRAKKVKTEPKPSKSSSSSSSNARRQKEEKNKHNKKHKKSSKDSKEVKKSPSKEGGKGKKGAKEESADHIWKWWEDVKEDSSVKWTTLEHKGPVFSPPYEPLPDHVKFSYNGKVLKLHKKAEEVACFYSKLIDHEYTTRDDFNKNFFKDWRKTMTEKERETITDVKKCDFREMGEYFKQCSEERKIRTKEEKLKEKEKTEALLKEFGFCTLDGYKQKIGNFKIEPPGLFRGRGTHPKMGMLKRRVVPEDVIINCSKKSKYPEPPPGHKWKEIRHDNTVTWLACWQENIMGSYKYVMLNPSSKIKGEKDWQKYETARKLKTLVDQIRTDYREDFKSKEMKLRQRAVALYFIDILALRAGNEKEEGETADTVGCCSLRVEHTKLFDELAGKECIVEFDFLGKDSIRYLNKVQVEKRVFKNLRLFMENKSPGDDLFDRLNTTILNKYLQSLMEGLTAKVFRTYNASHTLQEQLKRFTTDDMAGNESELTLAYNRANREVALLCNHQRAVSKTHDKQMENLGDKMKEKKMQVKEAKKEYKDAKIDYKRSKTEKNKKSVDSKKKKLASAESQLKNIEIKATDKEENKEIALGTSKLNYLDPRITVQWCLTNNVNMTRVYNKTHREKFQWAIDMVSKMNEEGEVYEF